MLGKLGQPIPRTYQLEEELGLICLQSSLGVQGDVGAARVILSAEGRGKGEFLDELRSGKELSQPKESNSIKPKKAKIEECSKESVNKEDSQSKESRVRVYEPPIPFP